jgi:ABC-type Fe3+/spermidine/putrescine transport system ATPase subunit
MVMSDRIALLRSGELEQVAGPREIYGRPATSYVAQFIGHTNLLEAEVRGGIARCSSLSWPVEVADGAALFSLRPENIRVVSSSTPVVSGRVRVRGRIVNQAFHGATELIRVQCADGLVVVVRTPSSVACHAEVELEFSPADAVPVRKSAERN